MIVFLFGFQADGLTIIAESDWKSFCEEWNVPKEKGISAEIDFICSNTNKLVGTCEVTPILEENLGYPNGEVKEDLLDGQPILKTSPEVSCDYYVLSLFFWMAKIMTCIVFLYCNSHLHLIITF